MSLREFLNQPKKECCTTLTIGRPLMGKSFLMLNALKYWISVNMFDEYHLVLPMFEIEQKASYDFLKEIKAKKKFIFIYLQFDSSIVSKILEKNKNPKTRKKVFFCLDDTTSQKDKTFRSMNLLKLAVESRHYDVHTWIITHYGRGIIGKDVRSNIGFLFIHRVKWSLIPDIYDELIDFPEDFPDLEHFETFMKSVFNKKYGSVLFSSVTDSFNDNCNEWPQIIQKTLNKKS